MKRSKRNSGFTLLEVMIALTIMTIAFAAILTSQSGSINLTTKTKEFTIAGWLGRNIMVESEHLMESKPFSELQEETSENFKPPFEQYKWKRTIKEVKFPDFSMNGDKKNESIPEPVRILTKVLTNYLNKAIREMSITISWPRGKGEQTVTFSTYLVDLKAPFEFTP